MTWMRLQHCGFVPVNEGRGAKAQVRGRSRRFALSAPPSKELVHHHNDADFRPPSAPSRHVVPPSVSALRPYAERAVDRKGNNDVDSSWISRGFIHTRGAGCVDSGHT